MEAGLPDGEPRYIARRSPVLATRGMVACAQPLAAEAGLQILRAGGNAIDAAIAIAAAMAVTEPTSTGLGGDCFVLYRDARTGVVTGLNGSGNAPAALTIERARSTCGITADGAFNDKRHAHTVTVPGAAAGWADALAKWGTFQLREVLAPAIRLARAGFPVSPLTAHAWARGSDVLWRHAAESGSAAAELLVADSTADHGLRAPHAGELFTNEALASVLEDLAAAGASAFYGPGSRIAESIVDAVRAAGGVLSIDDLAAHKSTFPTPVATEYRGILVHELPPN